MQLPSLYTAGIPNVLQAEVIFMLILGTVVGIIIGALPGLTVTMGVALLTPLTFRMETAASFALLLGAYCGGTYGGSITAILLRIPGALPAVMTTLDGYPMAQRGEAGRALGITITTSVIGGVVSALVLALLAPPLAELAVKFSAQEYSFAGYINVTDCLFCEHILCISLHSNTVIKGVLLKHAFRLILIFCIKAHPSFQDIYLLRLCYVYLSTIFCG